MGLQRKRENIILSRPDVVNVNNTLMTLTFLDKQSVVMIRVVEKKLVVLAFLQVIS